MEQAAVIERAARADALMQAAESTGSARGGRGTARPDAKGLRRAKGKPIAPDDGDLVDPDDGTPGLRFHMKPLNTNSVKRASCPQEVLLVAARHNLRIDNKPHRHRSVIDGSRTHMNEVLVGAATPEEVVAEAAQAMAASNCEVKRCDQIMGIEFVIQPPPGWDCPEFWRECLGHLGEQFERVLHAVVHRDQKNPHMHAIVLPIKGERLAGGELTQGARLGCKGRHSAFMQHMRSTLGLRPDRPAPPAPEAVVGIEDGGHRSREVGGHRSRGHTAPTSTPTDFILGVSVGVGMGMGVPETPSEALSLVASLMALVTQQRPSTPPSVKVGPSSAPPLPAERAGHACVLRKGVVANPPAPHGWAEAYAHGSAASASAAPGKVTDRPYRLTKAQGDAAHADTWNCRTIALHRARSNRAQQRGYSPLDADDLAEHQHLRDVEGDDRRMCLECRHLERYGRCNLAREGKLPGADRHLEPIATILMRCEGFSP